MNKIYYALAISAIFAACTSESGTTPEEAADQSNAAKIEVVTGTLEDARDGQTYKTVQIKDQTWMAENLNFATDSSYCPHGVAEKCDEYGRLYTWSVAMDSSETVDCGYKKACAQADSISQPKVRGICPEGWHLPTDAEWDALIEATGDVEHAAKILKNSQVWGAYPGDDTYGFNVLPTGYRRTDGEFDLYDAYFWTSTENSTYNACARYINSDNKVVHRSYDKRQARSIRCIKD